MIPLFVQLDMRTPGRHFGLLVVACCCHGVTIRAVRTVRNTIDCSRRARFYFILFIFIYLFLNIEFDFCFDIANCQGRHQDSRDRLKLSNSWPANR